jgi:xanthine dehydrogenase YagS FAD-binding subunit
MRELVEAPTSLVDVTGLDSSISDTAGGGLRIGGATKNTAVAADRRVRERYPVLARAIVSGASAQVRNMATVAGNLLQRTRCSYFYDVDGSACNKRSPGQGCDARQGLHRNHAILGGSEHCIATHPSDMAVALASLDAIVHLETADGVRTLPFTVLHRLPGDRPDLDTVLRPGELITAIEIPRLSCAANSTYRKVRDRSSFAFALISVAAAVGLEKGTISDVRLAFGGVAAKPWRAFKAEEVLLGKAAKPASYLAAVDAELADAEPLTLNAFKVELVRRTAVSVLADLVQEAGTGQ